MEDRGIGMIARRHWRGRPIAFHSSKDYKALIRTKEYNALINRSTVTDSVFAPRNVKIETRECDDQENGLGQNGLGHKIFSCGIILRIAAFLRESHTQGTLWYIVTDELEADLH
ncbi:hypothetical protein [Paenibacillus cisolokensis]|uniref:hypothetical protein n=1 Tax=Paenibacillus cisolokensis TaxID=1658519 RepID=UPI001BCF1A65|nr:hypothetical protein [Paenibacillus cisolokensis]